MRLGKIPPWQLFLWLNYTFSGMAYYCTSAFQADHAVRLGKPWYNAQPPGLHYFRS